MLRLDVREKCASLTSTVAYLGQHSRGPALQRNLGNDGDEKDLENAVALVHTSYLQSDIGSLNSVCDHQFDVLVRCSRAFCVPR